MILPPTAYTGPLSCQDSSSCFDVRAPEMPTASYANLPPSNVFAAESSTPSVRPKAKTPMIAGIVCGSCVGLAWIIIFSMWLLKQHKKRVARRKDPERVALREAEALREKTGHTTFIIPPDPAVINGQRKPGESAFQDDRRSPSGGERLEDVIEGEEAVLANDLYAEHAHKPLKS